MLQEISHDKGRRSPAGFLASAGAHAGAALLLSLVSFTEARRPARYGWLPLVAPAPEAQPAKRIPPKPWLREPAPAAPPVDPRRPFILFAPAAEPPATPEPVPALATELSGTRAAPPEIALPPEARPPQPVVTGIFGEPAATSTAPQPPRAATTGAFPAAVREREDGPAQAPPQVGAFAEARPQTQAPVAGRIQTAATGFGGAPANRPGERRSGLASAVAVANFDSPPTVGAHSLSRGLVASPSFDPAVAQPTAPRAAAAKPSGERTEIQILEKPRPLYSEEARRLHIEGDVLVEVLFGESGRVRILRVVRGLGHGLDENAVRAAMGIEFRPAMENGLATGTVAIVRITFQLAY